MRFRIDPNGVLVITWQGRRVQFSPHWWKSVEDEPGAEKVATAVDH